MTHQPDDTLLNAVCALLDEYGFDGLADAMTIVLNEAMKVERARHLQAAPQVREGDFYPLSLEKGLRSERALKLALAEMYVQGVSTRAVAELCPALNQRWGG